MTQTMERAPSMDQAKIAEILEKLKDSPMARGEVPAEVTNASKLTTEPTATPTAASAGGNTRAATPQTSSKYGIDATSYLTRYCLMKQNGSWSWRTTAPFYAGVANGVEYYTSGGLNVEKLYSDNKNTIGNTVLSGIYIQFHLKNTYSDCEYDVYTAGGDIHICRLRSANKYFLVPYHDVLATGNDDFYISLTLTGGFIELEEDVQVNLIYLDTTDVSYGTHALQKFDLHFPSWDVREGPFPAVLTIHGGNWTYEYGSKSYFNQYTYTNRFITSGCAQINVEYRLINYSGETPTLGQMLADIQSVIALIKANYGVYIDTSKLALMGYSAGAHIALMYAYTHINPNDADLIPIKLVISEAGPTDISYNWDWVLSNLEERWIWVPVFQSLTGIEPTYENPPEGAWATALSQLSPISYTGLIPQNQRTVLIYSSDDTTVPPHHAIALFNNLSHSDHHEILDIRNVSHGDFDSAYETHYDYRLLWQKVIDDYKNNQLT